MVLALEAALVVLALVAALVVLALVAALVVLALEAALVVLALEAALVTVVPHLHTYSGFFGAPSLHLTLDIANHQDRSPSLPVGLLPPSIGCH